MTTDIAIPRGDDGKPRKPLGVVWYADEAGYRAVAGLCGDMDIDGYAAWREAAQAAISGDILGVPRVPVVVDAALFQAWCGSKRALPNAAARSRYVLERADEAFGAAWKAWKAGKKARRKLW